jgi:hypothetical protein
MLDTLLAAILAIAGHGAPHGQVMACANSVIDAIMRGAPLHLHGTIAHNCGRRSQMNHAQRGAVVRYVRWWTARH